MLVKGRSNYNADNVNLFVFQNDDEDVHLDDTNSNITFK